MCVRARMLVDLYRIPEWIEMGLCWCIVDFGALLRILIVEYVIFCSCTVDR